jgi:PKD repeat protein
MKKFLIFSVLCLASQFAFSQIARIDTIHTNKCAVEGGTFSTITLIDASTGSSISRVWTISGDPNTYIDQRFNKNFTSPGTYKIVLTVTYTGGIVKKDSIMVEIYPMPVFTILKGNDFICPSESIPFSYKLDDQTTSTITGVKWEFGDGAVSTDDSPVHRYDNGRNQETSFKVSLTLTDNNGCAAKIDSNNFIHVRSKPEVAFGRNQSYFCFVDPPIEGTPVFTNYTDTAAKRSFAQNTYIWRFGDGNTTTQQSPANSVSHTYRATGTYLPGLIATDQYGCSDSLVGTANSINVTQLVLRYTVSDTLVCELPDTLIFTGQQAGLSYRWRIPTLNHDNDWVRNPSRLPLRKTDIGTHIVRLTVTDQLNKDCSVTDSFRIRVYDKTPSTIFAEDTNECDPDHVISFENKTVYPWADDYGNAVTNWYFGDSKAGKNDEHTTTYTYGTSAVPENPLNGAGGGYGDYRVMMTGTTPYGCPMEPAYQWIHIFRMKAVAAFTIPDPQEGPPHGCRIELDYSGLDTTFLHNPNAPDSGHYVQLQNIEDSLVSSSEVVSYTWRWDYLGQWDPNDTTFVDVANSGNPFPKVPHIYADTGIYQIYMTLRNEQGCVHTIPVQVVMVGYQPLVDFTFIPDTNCKPDIQIRVFAYDSLDEHGNLVARAWANSWTWLDANDATLANGDTTTIQPNEVGSAYFKLQASHNGCVSEYVPEESSAGFVCPPIAKIDNPKPNDDGSPPVYCTFEEIPEIFEHSSAENGAMYVRWYAGDSYPGDDTARQSKSPLMVYQADETYSWDSTGWVEEIPVGNRSKGLYHTKGDITKTGETGNYGFTYGPADYLDSLKGVVTVRLWAANDSSLMPVVYIPADTVISGNDTTITPAYYEMNEPWGNHCGYCEHVAKQEIHISYAKMNFTVSQPTICQRDSVVFYDSTHCNVDIFGWGFKFDWADPNSVSDFVIGDMVSIKNYTPWPKAGNGATLKFKNTNSYRVVLIDTCNFGCERTDTLTFDVHPQSIPAFVSSADSILFNGNKDTICANDGGYLYLQDKSYSTGAFSGTKVTKWEWNIGSVASDTVQNPTLQSDYAGLYDLTLKITNEHGCTADSLFYDQVLINNLYAHFLNPGDRRGGSICNKTTYVFENESQVLLESLNRTTYLRYEWDWGDGDTSLSYGYANANPPANASHMYDLPDLVNKVAVKLKVTIVDPNTLKSKGCSVEYEDTVIIERPLANFTTKQSVFACPQDEQGIIGRTIEFNDSSQGNVTMLTWNFGDPASLADEAGPGPPTEDRYKNPTHTYSSAGKYDVLLIATDKNGCIDSMLMKSYIDIAGPRGSVSYSPTDGCAPITVTFDFDSTKYNLPEYMPDSIVINTDGASELTRVGNSPFFHSRTTYYNRPGKYRPSYTLYKTVVIGDKTEICEMRFMGKDTINAIQIVTNFNIEDLYCPGIPVSFENITDVQPIGTPATALWSFGNGDTTDTFNEGITQYDTSGKYTVTLTVNTGEVCSKSRTRTIEVMEFPTVTFTPDSADACDGLIVRFEADSLTELDKSRIVQYDWAFSDGKTYSRGKDTNWIERDFSVSGDYPYELTLTFISDSAGCSQVYPANVKINAFVSPEAHFVINPIQGQVGETFTFDASPSIPGDGVLKQWIWDFNDDSSVDTLTNSSTTHQYSISGERFVLLTIIDEYGCFDTIRERLVVDEQIHFANVFTPGGNCSTGKCVFRPLEAKGTFAEFRMEVYDKWGMRIWKNSCEDNSNKGTCPNYDGDDFWWDGTNAQGSPVPAGVYYWVIYTKSSVAEGKPIIKNGSVTIFR